VRYCGSHESLSCGLIRRCSREEEGDEWKTGALGAKSSRVAVEMCGAGDGAADEECLLRGRNKTMPFLERCRATPTSRCRVAAAREKRERDGVAARDG